MMRHVDVPCGTLAEGGKRSVEVSERDALES